MYNVFVYVYATPFYDYINRSTFLYKYNNTGDRIVSKVGICRQTSVRSK